MRWRSDGEKDEDGDDCGAAEDADDRGGGQVARARRAHALDQVLGSSHLEGSALLLLSSPCRTGTLSSPPVSMALGATSNGTSAPPLDPPVPLPQPTAGGERAGRALAGRARPP